ncbi:MAG: selenium cofactor biosynthesis protein YqeC [Acidimicrobiia bacterium]|nr:selenium cofactor biosynthesis protein YqeC [Acidimicrobiia bacterium]MDX2468095.1 selenium cofactor biosynthesis protein YqeC [Acidimicrobiia bacterium]
MTNLVDLLGLGDRELVSLVGGGGKSTMLFGLGDELSSTGKRVILTTTTKMGRYQTTELTNICWSADMDCVVDALDRPGFTMLVTGGDDHKVTGPPPEVVDHLFADSGADYIVVEADGSHGRPLKAPASHEPVVPSQTTMVVILMGIDAVGQTLGEVTHRVDEAVRFTDLEPSHVMTATDCASVLVHPDGALRCCPPGSRVLVALTKVKSEADHRTAQAVTEAILAATPHVAVVVVPSTP